MAKSTNREASGSSSQPKYKKAIKIVAEAEDLARTGALLLEDGEAYIYFMWGQPVHAVFREDDGTLLEGDRALSQIAVGLATAAKVSWKSNEVIQQHSLRCSSQEIIDTLRRMDEAHATPSLDAVDDTGSPASALSDVWTGEERRSAAKLRYTFENFPVIPTGPPLWADVPTNVIHLDVLLGSMPLVLVTYDGPGVKGVGIVLNHELSDALFVEQATMMVGKSAWDALMTREDGTVSAYEIEEDLAQAIPTLWRCRVMYRDLDTRWVNAEDMLRQYGQGIGDRGVIVHSNGASGVALFQRGSIAGVYTSANPIPARTLAPLLPLFASGSEGTVMLIVRDDEEEVESVRHEPPEEAPYDGAPAAATPEQATEDAEPSQAAMTVPPAEQTSSAQVLPEETVEPESGETVPAPEPPQEGEDAQASSTRLVWTPFQPNRTNAESEEFRPPEEERQGEQTEPPASDIQHVIPENPAPTEASEPETRWSWAYDSNGDEEGQTQGSDVTQQDMPEMSGNVGAMPMQPMINSGDSSGNEGDVQDVPQTSLDSTASAGGTGLNDVSMYPWGAAPGAVNTPPPALGTDDTQTQWSTASQAPGNPAPDVPPEGSSQEALQETSHGIPWDESGSNEPLGNIPPQGDEPSSPSPTYPWDWQQQTPPATSMQDPAGAEGQEMPSVAAAPDTGNVNQPLPGSSDVQAQQTPPASPPSSGSGAPPNQQQGGFSVFDFSSVFSPMSAPQNTGGPPMTPMSGFQQEPESGGGVSFDAIIADLVEIAKRTLGDKADSTISVLTSAEHSPPGIRQAIRAIRQTPIAGVTTEEVTGMATAMSNYVADRLSAL